MRLIKYDGRDIKLSERDWRQLCSRFDDRYASLNIFGYYCICIPALCHRYQYKCYLCPLGAVAKGTNRCTHLFDNIIGSELAQYLYLFDPVVVWSPKFDSEARQALQKIRVVLSVDKTT
ncbi:MAG: hypothetical protein A2144_13360 [Chloroflexi bacterium RBG_16_50_9]|nr:MAG: hypothetical protein A2144_13360 [Chloroflexi bacterium RBG_16_50_9]